MKAQKPAIQYKDGQRLLYEGSFRAIVFNVIMSSLLGAYLYNNDMPGHIVLGWLFWLAVVIIIRMLHCKIVLKKELFISSPGINLKIFLVLTLLTGLIWSSIYFIALPYTDTVMQLMIFLVFGGMSAGATSSLGIYIPAFLTYIGAIFMPVILFNFSFWDVNKAILSVIFLFYLLATTIIAKSFQRLLTGIFYLTEQNEILIHKLEELSITDSLTALYNKRHFTKIIKDEYHRAKRNAQPFAFISIDVDNFKLINDNFGHPFGDKFLTYIAYYLKNYLRRENDIIFRLGGDEFAAILVNSNEENTKIICDNIKNHFLKLPDFDYEPQDEDHKKVLEMVSLSIGVVYVPYETDASINQITERADQLLYDAKHEGKSQVRYIKL